jgi:uncharacterized membrane protein
MSKFLRKNIVWILLILAALLIGIFIGKIIQNIPLLQLATIRRVVLACNLLPECEKK